MNVFELFAKLGLDTSEYNKELDESEKKGSKFGAGLKKAAGVAAGAVTAATGAVVAFTGKSVQAGMDFDSAMSQVAATMGVTTDEIGNLRDFAQEMGSTTAFSATEAAEALNYMALAGYDADTSMSMLPTVLDLAAAGGIDLAEASDMVTDASSALGLSIEDTTVMVDQMAAASSASNTSVAQLGQAFLTVGATARNMAGGTNELATILGVLADNGIKGAEGGTHLRNIILALQNAADEDGIINFNNGLEDVAVSLYDDEGNMRSLVDVITEMQGGMEGMTQASKDAVVSGMFNKADLASVNALLGTSSERFDELSGKIGDAEGAAEAMASTQLDNLAGDITLFQSALEGAQIAISDSVTPELRDFVQFGTDGISRLTMAFQEGGLAGAMGELGDIISEGARMILDHAPDMIDAGMQLLEALGQGFMDNIGLIADTGAKILVKITDSLANNADEIGPGIVTVIHTLVSTFTKPEVAKPLLEGGIKIIVGLITGLAEATPELVGMIPEIIANLILTIEGEGPMLVDATVQLLGAIGVALLGAIGGLMGMSYDEIAQGISDVFGAAEQFGQDVLGWFSSIFEGDLLGDVGTFFSNLFTDFTGGFDSVLEVVTGFGDDVKEDIFNTFENAKKTVQDAVEKFKSFFKFDWSLPKPKLPHFKVSGGEAPWGFGGQGSLPKVSIEWYAKAMNTPYMLDRATLFGVAGGKLLGGGETGSELIYGHEQLMKDIGDVVDSRLAKLQIIAPIYIGGKKIDEQILTANARNTYRSGGR